MINSVYVLNPAFSPSCILKCIIKRINIVFFNYNIDTFKCILKKKKQKQRFMLSDVQSVRTSVNLSVNSFVYCNMTNISI